MEADGDDVITDEGAVDALAMKGAGVTTIRAAVIAEGPVVVLLPIAGALVELMVGAEDVLGLGEYVGV